MSVTISIVNDRDQSIEDAYDCDCCGGVGCSKCEKGKIIFRSSRWSLNMANGNFRTLMSALGMKLSEDYCGTWDGRELLAALDRFIPALAVRSTTEEQNENGARIINCGIDAEYVVRRIALLREIAMEAAKREELIVWG